MKMGLRIVASIINISFDGRPPVSLGTAVVDLLTIIPCSSDELLGSVLCASKAHLFSEQERNRFYLSPRRFCCPVSLLTERYLWACARSYKHLAPLERK